MAVRTFTNLNNLRINVRLKNGDIYIGHDIPENPFGDHSNLVSFWLENRVKIFPMSEVSSISLYEENNES